MKQHLGLGDEKQVDAMLADGRSITDIAKSIGCTPYMISKYRDSRGEEIGKHMDLPVKIRMMLEKSGNFGKLNEETQQHIVELYRENIPSVVVSELLGLEFIPSKEYTAEGGFAEKPEITVKDRYKQAQAEAKIKLIMAATTDPKPNDALRFLAANESTRNTYKAPNKESKGAIEIRFPGFSRELPEEDEEEKIIN